MRTRREAEGSTRPRPRSADEPVPATLPRWGSPEAQGRRDVLEAVEHLLAVTRDYGLPNPADRYPTWEQLRAWAQALGLPDPFAHPAEVRRLRAEAWLYRARRLIESPRP
jgi:hypothetical protein